MNATAFKNRGLVPDFGARTNIACRDGIPPNLLLAANK